MPVSPVAQYRSVDPFIEDRFSSSTNRFTRLITGAKNVILLYPDSYFSLSYDSSSFTIGPGICIKDDCMLHINQSTVINANDGNSYLPSLTNSSMLTTYPNGLYIFVLQYIYARTIPYPTASYAIIMNKSDYIANASNYIFLGSIQVTGGVITNIYDNYPADLTIVRPYPTILLNSVDCGWID